ncbi:MULTISPECIES: type II toxin-antitoxin system VapC family toxin [Haloferacaceae]|uniref:Type II toxin-antitoxin system VapC family toxin n=1 Tax=Halorubrum glutamatedens TaxID=2707018 RepID=A0ABD5QNM5_9EURY|nr:PIN domain-containing protein [Halobellus captivus]
MNETGAIPVFVDTGAFYARADADDEHHADALRLFSGVRSGEIPYRPIYTSQAVLAEFATLALYKLGHDTATRALAAIRDSNSVNVIPVGEHAFETAAARFADYDDQEISFVDHTTGVLADERDVEHVFAFDSDFRTLGFSLVPADVNVPE